MPSTLELPQSNQPLRALDPDLPFLAIEAAVDIDNMLSNRSEDFKAIQRLTDRLKNSIDLSMEGKHYRSSNQLDPATLTVLGGAVSEVTGKDSLQKVKDLIDEASKIVAILSSKELKKNRKDLEQARDFCVALSKAALAYHKSIIDLRPSHPFRR